MVSLALVKYVIHCLNAVRPFIQTVRVKISRLILTRTVQILGRLFMVRATMVQKSGNMISFVLIHMISQTLGRFTKGTRLTSARVIQQTVLLHGQIQEAPLQETPLGAFSPALDLTCQPLIVDIILCHPLLNLDRNPPGIFFLNL